MGINCVLFITCTLLLGLTKIHAKEVEQQRKYVVSSTDSLKKILDENRIDGLYFHVHDVFTYYDIYLDSPNRDLLKKGLSLRFRKRVLNNDSVTYALQLKNEMESDTGTRLEVDESELDFYQVKFEGEWTSLTTVLDVLFNQIENEQPMVPNELAKSAIESLRDWMHFKANGIVGPFQKLRNLGLDSTLVSSLAPVIFGSDVRIRIAVYILPNQQIINKEVTPKNLNRLVDDVEFAAALPNYIRVLECSIDSAVFRSFDDQIKTSHIIREFEVENKHSDVNFGHSAMTFLAENLGSKIQMRPELDSKYRQSMKAMY